MADNKDNADAGSTDDAEIACPTPTAHKRLEEIHHFWHQCQKNYQDPEQFRINLNACIQATRNLTFALQKEKSLIPGFDDWYSGWQERMKADSMMGWLNSSRVKIVHEGDLETHSRAIVRVQLSYHDAADEVRESLLQGDRAEALVSADSDSPATEFEPASPLMSLRDIAAEISADNTIPRSLRSQASLTVERVWIEDNLPNHELLDALAYGYGFLSQILADAHSLVGKPYRTIIEHEGTSHDFPREEYHQGRLPCMITSRADRTVAFTLEGQLASGLSFDQRSVDPELAEESLRQYKVPEVRLQTMPMSPVDMMPIFVANAKAILRSGDEHGWFIFYYRGRNMVHRQVLYARDRADKRDLAQRVAEFVAANSIDGIVEIGEVWVSSALEVDDEGVLISPTDSPNRTEALGIHAELATGETKSVTIPFRRRRFGRPVIEDPITGQQRNYFFEPTRAVWRLAAASRSAADVEEDSPTNADSDEPDDRAPKVER
ncbi:hypothetical protein OG809_03335 [Kribbella soli]